MVIADDKWEICRRRPSEAGSGSKGNTYGREGSALRSARSHRLVVGREERLVVCESKLRVDAEEYILRYLSCQ